MFELAFFLVLFVARNVTEMAIVPRFLDTRRPTVGRGLFSLVVMGIAYFASGVAVAYCLYRREPPPPLLYYPGLLLLAAGYLGRLVCLSQLGTAYSQSFETDPSGRLVTTGIYSVIRHPVYAFFLLELAAFVLVRPNAVSVAALVLVVFFTVYRIRKEEEELVASFGEQYRTYRKKTRAVLPYIL